MNKDRRKRLRNALVDLKEVTEAIERVKDEEQGTVDNLPDGIHNGAKGNRMQDGVYQLESILDELGSSAERVEEVIKDEF